MNNKVQKELSDIGIKNTLGIIYNPSYEVLYDEENSELLQGFEKVQKTEFGAVNVMTGIYTGRSPKDKYILKDETTRDNLWWTSELSKNDNKPIDIKVWNNLYGIVSSQLSNKKLYVVDAFCGSNKDTCLKVRFVMEVAWQAHFVKNMFIRPSEQELEEFSPDFHVLNGSKSTNQNFKKEGLNSETFIAFNLTKKIQIIGGSWYGGEMKKGMFSVMNYLLPQKDIASMHCSANQGEDGSVALFFGLSGTGKTTLSTDPKRQLIGDDEHGWDKEGVFNFEGGCYAKTIDLDKDKEPDIFKAIRRDALLENVTVNSNGIVDYSDTSIPDPSTATNPSADTTANTSFSHWRDMIAAKKVASSDISHVITRHNWTSGRVYQMFKDTETQTNLISTRTGQTVSNAGGTATESATMYPIYVMNTNFGVYKCLYNAETEISGSNYDQLKITGSGSESGEDFSIVDLISVLVLFKIFSIF